jgi:hypothetical protein
VLRGNSVLLLIEISPVVKQVEVRCPLEMWLQLPKYHDVAFKRPYSAWQLFFVGRDGDVEFEIFMREWKRVSEQGVTAVCAAH